MADPARVAPHLHAPLQSGSDRVLRRMGRHWYSATGYASAASAIAARAGAFALGADVITGFPGETDADHAATIALVRALPFTYLHVFPIPRGPERPPREWERRASGGLAGPRRRTACHRGIEGRGLRRESRRRAGGRRGRGDERSARGIDRRLSSGRAHQWGDRSALAVRCATREWCGREVDCLQPPASSVERLASSL